MSEIMSEIMSQILSEIMSQMLSKMLSPKTFAAAAASYKKNLGKPRQKLGQNFGHNLGRPRQWFRQTSDMIWDKSRFLIWKNTYPKCCPKFCPPLPKICPKYCPTSVRVLFDVCLFQKTKESKMQKSSKVPKYRIQPKYQNMTVFADFLKLNFSEIWCEGFLHFLTFWRIFSRIFG